MKVAVTGGSGFVGRHVVDVLLERGYEVVAVGRTVSQRHKNLTVVRADLIEESDYSWIEEYRPSHLLHLAWYAEHGKFWTSPLNVSWCEATARLAEAFCKRGGKRIVVAGSCAEYDWSFGYCKEDRTPTNPATLYGTAKDSARRLVEGICKIYGVQFAWGRIFLPFGPGEDSRRLVPLVVDALLERGPLFAINTQHWRDFLPVETVARGFVFLLERDVSGVFNVSSGRPVELRELIKRLGQTLDSDPEPLLKRAVQRVDPPRLLVGDNTAILDAGWRPEYDLWSSVSDYAKYIAGTGNTV